MKFLTLLLLFFPFLIQAQSIKKTLIIGIDGCRPDALATANTPNLDNLIANGIYSPDALNDDITYSGPGWSAILCGVWSDKHLVTSNAFIPSDYDTYPSIIKRIEDYNPDFNTASIGHWNPINDLIVQGFADYKLNVSSDQALKDEASAYLTNNDPDFMFIHFDEVDGAGHGSGFTALNPTYTSTIESVDAHIGDIMTALQNRPNYGNEDWLILVTTDHGGLGTNHGGNSFQEKNVFVIASGNNVETTVLTKDSTVTANTVMNCLGDETELAMDGDNDFVQIPNDPLFDFGSDRDFTIECRIRTNIAADVAIIGNKDWDSGNNKGFIFSFKFSSGPEWKVNIGDGFLRSDLNTGGAIADNEWHTLSVSFDRDGMMKMYQDGVFLDETSISLIGDITTNEGLFMGVDIDGDYAYNGSIAEVRVWDSIIGDSEIANWYCTSVDNTHPNYNELIGHWKMNEGQGNTVTDYSPYGNNGSIQNATWVSPDSIVVYDYSNTPRLVDLVPTAFTHLCIPIESSWDLDGASLIGECIQMDLSMKVFLEGAMNASGTMNPVLSNNGLLTQHPYNGSPYNYTGPSLTNTIPANAVDYILVELRRGLGSNNTIIHQQVAFVLDNGDVVLEDGSLPNFLVSQSSTYQIWLRHHNHLDILSSEAISPAPLIVYNFLSPNDAMGPEQLKDVGNGIYALFAGDINQDGTISVTDYDTWISSPAILNQYTSSDVNLDGTVQTTDYDVWFENKAKIGFAQNQ